MKFLWLCLVLIGVFGLSLSNENVVDTLTSKEREENSQEKHILADKSDQRDNKTDPSQAEKSDYIEDDYENHRKRFGFVLGKGFSFGKRFGSVLGHGMTFGKRYGSVLGKGFAFGKRDPELYENENAFRGIIPGIYHDQSANKRNNDENIDEDLEFVDLSGPVDEKKWILNDIYGSTFPGYKRSKRDTGRERFIHYYGNIPGRGGFSMGKNDETAESNSISGELGIQASLNNIPSNAGDEGDTDIEKRFVSGLNGNGYISGKRQYNPGRSQRQSFGSVLGKGFSFGKRKTEMDDTPLNIDSKYAGDNENDPQSAIDRFHQKRYFHSSPGYRFLFGKRDTDDRDKRFGFVLGRGYSFGKRGKQSPNKRFPYGFVLGRGFSFGKRSSELNEGMANVESSYAFPDLENDPYVSKRASFVLGRGYVFGKRGDKRFGWVLGNGLSFGKRDGTEQEYQEPEVSQFIDEFGNTFIRTDFIEDFDKLNAEYLENSEQRVFGCAGRLIPQYADSQSELMKTYKGTEGTQDFKKRSAQHQVNYFLDDMGHFYVNADDITAEDNQLVGEDNDITYYTCDGQVIELLGDNDIYDDVSKRGWGSVLGRGFRFGKRFGSKKRFGHILGSGLAWGK